MQAADMNGDGKLDLVASVSFGRGTGPGNSGTNIAVMLGNGNGTFAPAAFYDVGDTSGIVAPVVGDFNGDGKPDVGVGNSDGTVSILLNQGNGVLGTAVVYANGEAGGPPIVADFNGDGKLDILTTGCGTNGINVLPGNGDGTFGSPITSGGYVCGPSVIAADFNNDGKLDLAVGGPTGTQSAGDLTILLGNGDGTFTPAGNPFTIVPICSPNNVGGPWNMAAADLNMDGNLDLIVAQSPSIACGDNLGVIVYTGNGDGTFSQNVTGAPFLVGDNPTGVLVGDFNKDGMPDVAVFNAVGFEAGNAVNTFVTVLLNRTLPVSASPASLNYYTQLLGTSSKAQTVVLTNDTSSPYSLSGLAVTGTDSADFKLVNHCSTSLKAGLKCSLNVTFDPAVSGTRTAAVTGAGSATVSLTGIATQVKLSPAKLNFGSVTVGQSSTPQTVTVTNVGASSLNFTGTRIKVVGVDAGDFSETNNCGASLGAGLSCTITVTFKPTATGTRGADVRITDNGGASPQYVRLGGTGT